MTPIESEVVNQGLIIDNFAGGGGASTGIELALGRSVDYAINHDPDSIAMHQPNHPNSIHLCEDVFKVNPVKLCAGRPVLLAWFSPDCKHFSKAKGGKPADKHIRGLAWVTIKWAKTVKPKIILLENVEEFQTWGPLGDDGRPIKEKMGTTFHKFISELRNLGYDVDYRELVAADYGAPTKRKRFFMIARCDGKPIRWPEKTYAERGKCKRGQKPWRSAASIIDFSIPTRSIFNREKDLAEPTKRRIGRGLEKFVLRSGSPFIIPIGYGENKNQLPRVNDLKDPLSTVVSSTKQNLVVPYLQDAQYMANESRRLLDLNEPHPTISAGGQHTELCNAKLTPFMALIGENGFQKYRDASVEDPLKTIVTKNEHLLCKPYLSPWMGLNNFTDYGRNIKNPLATITTNNKEVFLAPKLMPFISENYGGTYTGSGSPMDSPLPTITASDHNRIIAPILTDYKFANDGSRADSPLGTETTIRSHYLTSSYLTEYYGHGNPDDVKKPLGTITSHDRFGKVDVSMKDSAFIQEYYGGTYKGNGTKMTDPLATVTTLPRFWMVKVHFEKAEDESKLGNWKLVREFINKYTTVHCNEDQILLISIDGHDYFISDIGMRMLTPRELYDAQGFPHDYIIDKDANGKSYPANKQVARCGNAVPPPFAEALVRANLPDLCPKTKIETMQLLKVAQLRYKKNRAQFNGVSSDGQLSLFTDFESLTKQVAEERKGHSDA